MFSSSGRSRPSDKGGGGGHPDPEIKRGSGLKIFLESFSIRKLDVLCSLHNSRFMREASLIRHFTREKRESRDEGRRKKIIFFFSIVSRFAQNAAFASLRS